MPLICIRGTCLRGIAKRGASSPSRRLQPFDLQNQDPVSPRWDREYCRTTYAEAQEYSRWLAWSAKSVPAREIMDSHRR